MNIKRLAEAAIERKRATQKIVEFASLLRLLKSRKLKTIVEIGTAQGGLFMHGVKLQRQML